METKFAPAERDNLEKIMEENQILSNIVYMKNILRSFSFVVFVLNEKRQIVFVNDVLLTVLGIEKEEFIMGWRYGEVLGCIHSREEPGGCGTSESCRYCGLINTILKAQKTGSKEANESVIVVKDGDFHKQLDIEVTVTPFFHDKQTYYIVSFSDVSVKKKKQAMERIFYHDIINVAGSLSGIIDLLPNIDDNERKEFLSIAAILSTQVIEEIKAQREMQQAEDGELSINKKQIILNDLLKDMAGNIRFHRVAENKKVVFHDAETVILNTDTVLLTRIVINMMKNSLEAIQAGGEIHYGLTRLENEVRIWVQNEGIIPKEAQVHIFQRSFSTKGKGRGLGTYSIKLLGERYLGGKVGFTSTVDKGTVFFIDLLPE